MNKFNKLIGKISDMLPPPEAKFWRRISRMKIIIEVIAVGGVTIGIINMILGLLGLSHNTAGLLVNNVCFFLIGACVAHITRDDDEL